MRQRTVRLRDKIQLEHAGVVAYVDHEPQFVQLVEALDLARQADAARFALLRTGARTVVAAPAGIASFEPRSGVVFIHFAAFRHPATLAAALVHEAVYACLHRRGVNDAARSERIACFQMTRFLRRYLARSGDAPHVQRAWLTLHSEWAARARRERSSPMDRLRDGLRGLRRQLKARWRPRPT